MTEPFTPVSAKERLKQLQVLNDEIKNHELKEHYLSVASIKLSDFREIVDVGEFLKDVSSWKYSSDEYAKKELYQALTETLPVILHLASARLKNKALIEKQLSQIKIRTLDASFIDIPEIKPLIIGLTNDQQN